MRRRGEGGARDKSKDDFERKKKKNRLCSDTDRDQ